MISRNFAGLLLSLAASLHQCLSSTLDYSSMCDTVKCRIVERCCKDVEEMRRSIDEGTPVASFGEKCTNLCDTAIAEFASKAPTPSEDNPSSTADYEKVLEDLEQSIDMPMQVLFLKQLALLREDALRKYKSASGSASSSSDYEAMVAADEYFASEAEKSVRRGSGWTYAAERTHLQSVMSDVAAGGKRLADVQLKAAQQQTLAMQYLQMQQQTIQQLQQQLYGQTSPWNVGFAYRIPDSNFNLQGSHQQGKTNFQFSCVPDEYAPMLGPNGFTNGVGPGNLGLSLNVSV